MRGESLFAIVCLGLFPMHFLLTAITLRLFPPDVESAGQFRGILYGRTESWGVVAGTQARGIRSD
jgi:hypothetical protein